jgi:hypothetical protein
MFPIPLTPTRGDSYPLSTALTAAFFVSWIGFALAWSLGDHGIPGLPRPLFLLVLPENLILSATVIGLAPPFAAFCAYYFTQVSSRIEGRFIVRGSGAPEPVRLSRSQLMLRLIVACLICFPAVVLSRSSNSNWASLNLYLPVLTAVVVCCAVGSRFTTLGGYKSWSARLRVALISVIICIGMLVIVGISTAFIPQLGVPDTRSLVIIGLMNVAAAAALTWTLGIAALPIWALSVGAVSIIEAVRTLYPGPPAYTPLFAAISCAAVVAVTKERTVTNKIGAALAAIVFADSMLTPNHLEYLAHHLAVVSLILIPCVAGTLDWVTWRHLSICRGGARLMKAVVLFVVRGAAIGLVLMIYDGILHVVFRSEYRIDVLSLLVAVYQNPVDDGLWMNLVLLLFFFTIVLSLRYPYDPGVRSLP